jgi:integrase
LFSGFPFNSPHGGDMVATNATRLTKRVVDGFKPNGARTFIAFDAEIKGFGCRVSPSGIKTFVLEYRPGAGGRGVAKRRLILGRYGAMSVEQARQAAMTALAHIRLGADPQAEKARQRASCTTAELIDLFIAEHVRVRLKPKTAIGYEIALRKLRSAHGRMIATQVTRAHMAALHIRLVKNPYAANRFLAVVSKLFSWAIDRGLVPERHLNPTARVTAYREHSRERFLTPVELASLGAVLRMAETEGLPYTIDETKPGARHAAKPENRCTVIDPFAVAAIRLLTLTGARLREILHAKWEFVDVARGLIFLPDSKTGRKPVYLNAAALTVLGSLVRAGDNPYIFPGRTANQPRADLKKPWRAITSAAELNGIRIHDLRHTFASIGAGARLGLPIIGKLLGHSQPRTTARYAHLDADPVRSASDIIGAQIESAMRGEMAIATDDPSCSQ